jgi:hypothetical protein
MLGWLLIAAVQGAQTPVMLELPAQAPCTLSTALPLALAEEKLVVATSPLTLKVQVEREALAVSLVEHGAVHAARELGFRADDCPVLPQVIAALARAWVDGALQAREKALERPVEPAVKARTSASLQAADAAFAAIVNEPEPKKLSQTVESEPPPPPNVPKPSPPPPPPPPCARVPGEEEKREEPSLKRPIVAFDASIALLDRSFSYSQVGTMNLRSYSAPMILDPELRLELYPLALLTKGPLAGVGVDGSYSTSFFQNSRRSGTAATWPTSMPHYDVNLRYRWTPLRTLDAALIPFVGYDDRRFNVGTGTDGTQLDGLAMTSYSSIRLGVAAELPILNSGIILFGKLAALIVMSSGQIISTDYFPHGSNFGIEGQLGVGYRIVGPLQIRLAFDYTHYGMTFQTTASDTYVASGAVDLYMAGRLGVRLVF